MKLFTIAGLLLALALAMPVAARSEAGTQQTPSYYTPEERAEIRALPFADDSLRVAAADIDALLADGAVVFLDVREPDEIEDLGTPRGTSTSRSWSLRIAWMNWTRTQPFSPLETAEAEPRVPRPYC